VKLPPEGVAALAVRRVGEVFGGYFVVTFNTGVPTRGRDRVVLVAVGAALVLGDPVPLLLGDLLGAAPTPRGALVDLIMAILALSVVPSGAPAGPGLVLVARDAALPPGVGPRREGLVDLVAGGAVFVAADMGATDLVGVAATTGRRATRLVGGMAAGAGPGVDTGPGPAPGR